MKKDCIERKVEIRALRGKIRALEEEENQRSEKRKIAEAEFQFLADEICKFESQSISVEGQELESLTSVDVSCEIEETQSVVSEENKLEKNCECQSQNLENEDDACDHEPLFMLNADKGPELECVPSFMLNVDKGPELECVVEKTTKR